MPMFVYPKELRKGDQINIIAEGQSWREEVDSITVNEDDPENHKVLVFTKARMLACDPGMKVQISVLRGPEPEKPGDHILTSEPNEGVSIRIVEEDR